MMLDAAARAGAAVWQPWRAAAIERCDREFSCTLAAQSDVKRVAAPIVIRANGSWERAALLDPDRNEHRAADLLAFKAHFRDADLPADLMPLLIFPGGYGGMVRTDDGRLTLSCCIRRDALQRCRRDFPTPHAGEAVLKHIAASCVGVRDALARARLDGAFLSAGPIRPGIRRRYADGVFVIGNAAGEAHPIVAEGISMAMQSAWLLCRQLIARQDAIMAGAAHDEVGAAYARDWNASFATRTRAAAAFAFLLTRSRVAAPALRILESYPGIMTMAARLAGKAKVIAAAA
jgi:flavin-dependent dehydrogenase